VASTGKYNKLLDPQQLSKYCISIHNTKENLMAVIAVWKCDRDGAMFDTKKEADNHDSMLELAANITLLLEQEITGLNEEHAEKIGLVLAQRREVLAKALKGKPDLLLEQATAADSEAKSDAPAVDSQDTAVTKLTAAS
jgi:dsDNA-binding SOS-regulon protein